MRKYGNITYPDRIDAIIMNKRLLKVVFKFLEKEQSHENLLFIMAGFNPEKLYKAFLKVGADYGINIGAKVMTPMRQMAAAGQWKHPEWVDKVAEAKSACKYLLDSNALPRFFKSKIFWDYHVANGGTRHEAHEYVADPPPPPAWDRAAEHFGIKNVAALRFYIAKFERSGEQATIGDAAKLLRSEGKRMNAHIFNKLLISEGFAKKPAGFDGTPTPPSEPEDPMDSLPEVDEETGREKLVDVSGIEITLHRKRLEGCGFKLVKKPRDLERIENMLRAYLAKDRQEAMRLYERILKEEKGNKELQTTSLVDMMKKMREKKAFEKSDAA